MIDAGPRKLRPAIGGGFVIQAKDGQDYITGREREWNGSSWLGYPCDEDDKVTQHLPMVEVFPVYERDRLVGYSFSKPCKEQ